MPHTINVSAVSEIIIGKKRVTVVTLSGTERCESRMRLRTFRDALMLAIRASASHEQRKAIHKSRKK